METLTETQNYVVKDISLAEQGRKNLAWAELQMGGLLKVRQRLSQEKPFAGIKIGLALHITKETGVLVRTMVAGGADVAIASCNPLSTQDDIAAALAEENVKVFGYKGETDEDYYRFLENVIKTEPNITIDDGMDLVQIIHQKYPHLIPNIIGGAEETTTGVIRLKAMEADGALKYPIVAVNDSKTKHLMDNIKGTGQSTFDGILRASNVIVAGKTVVVVGYGNCGKGVAKRAQGMDANVIVTEVDHFAALQAAMDGFRVMPMAEACKLGDIFVTLTGNKHVIDTHHAEQMKDGAVVANSGHFDIEINVAGMKERATGVKRVRPFLDEFTMPSGNRIYLCAEGRLVNLAAAEGHPSTIMSMSFMNQCFAAEFLLKNRGQLEPKVYVLPEEKDQEVSKLQLEAMNVQIDTLTPEQIKYLNSWDEGT